MVDRTEYTVLRFVERNGYCFMTNDTVKGSSVMQCVLKDKTVPKQQIFKWLIQIAHQIEQYYKCEKERAYGCMNPYAVIVVGADMISLLDPMEAENYELIKRMQKKKVHYLSARTAWMTYMDLEKPWSLCLINVALRRNLPEKKKK